MSGTAAGGASNSGASTSVSALGGLGGSLEDKDCDLLCPVCFELIDEAYVTRCGHSFCYACIAKSVELHRRCPKCGAQLTGRDHYFPNFLLNELVARRRLRTKPTTVAPSIPSPGDAERLRALVAAEARHLGLSDVDGMLDVLTRRKRLLEAESAAAHHRLLYEFLSQLLRHRSHQLEQLSREATLVRKDLDHVGTVLRELKAGAEARIPSPTEHSLAEWLREGRLKREISEADTQQAPYAQEEEESFGSVCGGGWAGTDALAQRWRRLAAHFDDFVQCYFAHRADELYFPGSGSEGPTAPVTPGPVVPSTTGGASEADHVPQQMPETRVSSAAAMDQTAPDGDPPAVHAVAQCGSGDASMNAAFPGGDQRAPDGEPPVQPATPVAVGTEVYGGLDAFREDLAAFTRYRALRPLATLSYCSDAINYSTIVSTIEFDKDDEFFAIAGVTKRIKVFEFESVVRDAVDVHYPCAEMQCSHKISCVSWNAYHKNVLASSDYEGTVAVWDAATGLRTRALQEHDKRCWSVHFNRADVRLLASGSDDARVKLWSLNAERSVATLEAKFNVCCVRFNPNSSCHLAVGSADHCVHYYDLRAPRSPLAVLRDHRKAVSYVQFLDSKTLVSASTDSMLKLWRVDSPRCVRSFTGHANEKNFVGLATDGKYIACGSENNALYVYYNGVSKPLLAYRFEAVRGFLEKERRDEEPSEFVSAVCWRRSVDRPVLLAANSQGTIKVLELL
ncbi:E3 ubiquitin-protein ligase COP1-like [Pieris napi]|uniref:E3 ubiquitin-protein ligase COP1-like n=1 Tax=Pieris napi TaxID=78633 RepID=UPI001FBAA496|nr:E3 ubiquitin-protein ligase COP1-like [Pieris napi]XP_047518889.1 E3 ubiquitin-protein ligase COP1-like [Pieris napi]